MRRSPVHRFKNILFSPLAARNNPAAARRVAELAARNQAGLTFLGAVPEPSRLQRLLQRAEQLEEIQAAETAALAARLARYVPSDSGLSVDVETTAGSPALRIIERVLAADHDLVVVTTDDEEEDRATIGRLLRKCPCPVWVMRPTRARVQRVLVAVNPDPAELDLNRVLLQLAASMVNLHGGELHVVHAWELYGEETMRRSAFLHVPAEELESLLRDEEASHRAALDELLGDVGLADEPWQTHLLKGRAATVVPELVATARINLLVMGTVARTGISGLLIGNTAETILSNVRCSVIAVKPPDFVSPIHLDDIGPH